MTLQPICKHGTPLELGCAMCAKDGAEAAWDKANRDIAGTGYIVYKDEGVDAILNQRGHTHGEFKDNARLAGVWRAMLRETPNWKSLNWPQQLALDEIVLKMARVLSAGADPNCKEHWDDIAGYATLGGKACLKEEQKPRRAVRCNDCEREFELGDEFFCGDPNCKTPVARHSNPQIKVARPTVLCTECGLPPAPGADLPRCTKRECPNG